MSDPETQPLIVTSGTAASLNAGTLEDDEEDFSSNTAALEDGTFHARRISLDLHAEETAVDVLPHRSIGLLQV